MVVLDAGADEIVDEGETFAIVCDPSDLRAVAAALDEAEIAYETDEMEFIPSMKVDLDVEGARKFLHLYDALEELDDVQGIYTNADLSDEVRAALDDEQ